MTWNNNQYRIKIAGIKFNPFLAKHSIQFIIIAFLGTLLISCAPKPVINAEGPYWVDDDRKPIPEPEFDEPNLMWTSIDRSFFDQGLELFDMDRNVRKISGNMTQAKNVNSFDEVLNSSWFTNRHGLPQTRMTSEEIATGVNITGGPDTTGGWTVFRPKVGGITPGFWIEDAQDNQYIIKFDLKGFSELSTGATIISGRFLHACGYNVAQETIVYWRPDNLRIKEGATIKGDDGEKRPFTMDDLQEILDSIEKNPDGSIRSVASLLLGNVKGPYMLKGTRKDDPNDWCPHQHRRDLRGLYAIASLINHEDCKDHNSMDTYVGKDGEGYIKHFLMDFGSTLGAAGYGPKKPKSGYANYTDTRDMGVSILTLGLWKWPWEDGKPWTNPAVGYFESEIFHPNKFDPSYALPTFENMTARDGYWGAKIVMAFSDQDMAALVKTGQYTDPEAEAIILQVLKERRDKIGRYWFGKINPLDFPIVKQESGTIILDFDDLSVLHGLEKPGAVYQVTIKRSGETLYGPIEVIESQVSLTSEQWQTFSEGTGTSENSVRLTTLDFQIKTSRDNKKWSEAAVFKLVRDQSSGQPRIVAIEH